MARRPERNEEVVLTRSELQQLQKRLESYEWAAKESFYRSAHNRCSLQPRWIPSPKAMQGTDRGMEGPAEGTLAGLIVIFFPVALVNAENRLSGKVVAMEDAETGLTLAIHTPLGKRS